MREIKFRAREIATKKYIYGNLIHYEEGANFSIFETDIRKYSEDVDLNTIGQYTGLNDGKGVDIYEGDILQYKDSNGVTQIGEVRYDQNHCCFIVQGLKSAPQSLNAFWEFKVVGNVYDNPELLYMYM